MGVSKDRQLEEYVHEDDERTEREHKSPYGQRAQRVEHHRKQAHREISSGLSSSTSEIAVAGNPSTNYLVQARQFTDWLSSMAPHGMRRSSARAIDVLIAQKSRGALTRVACSNRTAISLQRRSLRR